MLAFFHCPLRSRNPHGQALHETPPPRGARRRSCPSHRTASQDRGSAASDPGAADDGAHGRACRAGGAADGAAGAADHRRMLASRQVDTPAGFVQFQIARLSEAMIVARTMMMEGDLQAMDRLIRLTNELDRYHSFARSQIPAPPERPPTRRLAAPPANGAAT